MEEGTAATAISGPEGAPEDYSNATWGVDQRVDDLLGRMTLAEKAGMLFQTMIVVDSGDLGERSSAFGVESAEHMIRNQLLSHFNVVRTAEDAGALAEWHNRLQTLAASTRLGIPITLSTTGTFSQWPETLGFAAIGSSELMESFADIARQEYLAVGLRLALHPNSSVSS